MSTNEPMTQEQLDAIQARVDAATKGQWYFEPEYGEDSPYALESAVEKNGLLRSIPVAGDIDREQDAALIAHAPQDLTDLLAEVERRARPAVTEDMVERVARELADLEAGEDWPSNHDLGGGPCGTRDDEFRYAMRERAREVIAAALGTGEEA